MLIPIFIHELIVIFGCYFLFDEFGLWAKVFKGLFRKSKMADKKEVIEEEKVEKDEKKAGKPSWIKMSQKEMEKIVIDLAKEGEGLAKIGLILRDKYGVPKVKLVGGRGVKEILKENKIEFKEDKQIIEKHVSRLKEHLSKNKKDYPASRALTKKLWAVHDITEGELLSNKI